MRIKTDDVAASADRLNSFLKRVNVRVAGRYGYTALDLVDKEGGAVVDTLIAGLTKREAKEFLDAMERLLRYELG